MTQLAQMFTPFETLPEDILREIFMHCLPTGHNMTVSPKDAPVLLTHVCLRWRAVAFSTPYLWSSIHIPLPGTRYQDLFAKRWIARSGSLPLSVSFSSVHPRFGDTIQYLAPLFSLIQPVSTRLRNISFTLRGNSDDIITFMEDQYWTKRFNPVQQVSKVAVHIDVFDPYNREHFSKLLPSLGIHLNSRLTELHLSMNFHILNLPDCFDRAIPWRNIKVLDLQTRNLFRSLPNLIRNGVLLRILSRCFNVTQLKVFAGGALRVPSNNEAIPDMVVNAKLRHATLFFLDLTNHDDYEFISRCDWPALTSLHLGSKAQSDAPERIRILGKVKDKFGQKLTSLRITYSSMGRREHLLQFLAELPSLIQLHVEDGVIQGGIGDTIDHGAPGTEDEVIESLTPGLKEGYGCPDLQYLRWDGHTAFSDKSVINLLLQRAESQAPLKQVVMSFDRGAQEDVVTACSRLLADGLRINLAYNVPQRREWRLSGVSRDLPVEEDPLRLGWDIS